MSRRNYSNFAQAGAPASSIASGDTSIDVDTQTDYPDAPYVIVVYEGGDTPPAAPKKEVMRVTAVSGSGPYTLTVERDIDGYNSGGVSFTPSATVQHISIADEVAHPRSFREAFEPGPGIYTAYDDFNAPDGTSLNGRTLPTGQTWTVEIGAFEIQNNEVIATNAPAIATLDASGWGEQQRFTLYSGGPFQWSRLPGFCLNFNDAQNYVFTEVNELSHAVKEVNGGSVSTISAYKPGENVYTAENKFEFTTSNFVRPRLFDRVSGTGTNFSTPFENSDQTRAGLYSNTTGDGRTIRRFTLIEE